MENFAGYGNPAAPYWYVGMEEGGDREGEFISKRLDAWDVRGGSAFEDLMEYHRVTDLGSFFHLQPKLQTTWKQLIRITLVAERRPFDTDAIREYQALKLGRRNGETALLELFSLPVSALACWPYDKLSNLPNLQTRELYRRTLAPRRVQMIKNLIDQHVPEFVVMYGTTYLTYWEQIHGGTFLPDGNFLRGRRGSTEMILIRHPAARGSSNLYFEEVGRRLGDLRNAARQGRGEKAPAFAAALGT